ncbi:MAG TPA: hypothetical protein VFH68_19190 [Polyangia bacterium]|jgi:hypothetical protein|nr:hypothetical protein [Polyangia bacterium]
MSNRRREIGDRVVAAVLSAMATLLGGCGSDVFNVDVDLQRQTYSADFGNAQGSIPMVTCDPAGPDICGAAIGSTEVPTGTATAEVQTACDATMRRCFARARVVGAHAVDILQDDSFVTTVERRAVVIVRDADIAITVPVNSLTFDVPAIQIFVGPAGSTRETDPGVVAVGVTEPLAAGATVGENNARHLVVRDNSPAHNFLSQSIFEKKTMVFLVVMAPRLDAGAPVPAGAFQVDLAPRLTLGL